MFLFSYLVPCGVHLRSRSTSVGLLFEYIILAINVVACVNVSTYFSS